jgi:hypothetical protein
LHSCPGTLAVPQKIPAYKTVKLAECARTLRGRNRACLVKTEDGRYFVQKLSDNANGSDHLFNEAFASQLGAALGLPFAPWSELVGLSPSDRSSFGSELISGDIFEYLPGGWYQNIENRRDIYRTLLFDLWCNHADTRQAIFQARSRHVLHVYFVDHDRAFSTDDGGSLYRLIARTQFLDSRIYKNPPATLARDLREMIDDIGLLTRYKLELLEESVQACWGTMAHRKQAISGLRRRIVQLPSYVEAIMKFVGGLDGPQCA